MQRETAPGTLRQRTLLRLAWRNLARNRKRTWITAATVAIAVLMLNISMSLLLGVEQQSFDNLINFQTAHAKVFAEGYFPSREELPLDYLLTDLEELQRMIRSVDGVAATTPRLAFSAQLSNGVDQIACLGVGIQVTGSDTDVFRIPQAVIEGDYLKAGEEGLLLGSGLAELFEVTAGDWLTILTKTQTGAYEALDLPVVGLLGTGNPLIDRTSFLLPLSLARYVLDIESGATEVAIRFAPTASEPATLRRLQEAVGTTGLEVKGWRDIEEDFLALVKTKRTAQGIFLSIFVVLAVVGITNTVLMAAFERTREIGMLMAMGMRGTGIRRLFLTEGALTGLLGGAVGIAVAVALIAKFAISGIDFSSLYGEIDTGYPVKDLIYPSLNVVAITTTWLLTGVLATLAALYPAARASRKDPVEALRHV